MDAHELVAAVKALALDLGRTPTRSEFESAVRGGRYQLTRLYRNYALLLQAAGLETYEERRSGRKIDNTVFQKNLEAHLDEYEPRAPMIEREPYKRTLFVPDVHAPFAHLPTLEKIYRFAEREQPEIIVQVGDLKDRISHGRFPRSHNVFTPEQEEEMAHKQATEMWAELRRASPQARCIQLAGNHDLRPLKQALTNYPEAETWIKEGLKKSMTFDGVETILDQREELFLPGDVMVIHGHYGKLGDHRDFALMNAVVGHQHVGGVVYRQIRGRVLWELNCGLAGDPEAKGLSYTPQRIVKWTLGWGWLDEYGPRFIPA